MNSKIPTCTAIILSYCDRDVFEKIDVALRQSHQFNNIIIVDDGSTHDLTDELIHYVKNIEKGVLQKLSFKNDSSSFVTEDMMPLKNELTYFFFTNNNQNYVLYEDEKIEIVKLP